MQVLQQGVFGIPAEHLHPVDKGRIQVSGEHGVPGVKQVVSFNQYPAHRFAPDAYAAIGTDLHPRQPPQYIFRHAFAPSHKGGYPELHRIPAQPQGLRGVHDNLFKRYRPFPQDHIKPVPTLRWPGFHGQHLLHRVERKGLETQQVVPGPGHCQPVVPIAVGMPEGGSG